MKIQLLSLAIGLCLSLCVSCSTDSNTWNRSRTDIKVATEKDPQTLDPRLARDLLTATSLHMLYEGLMQKTPEGSITLALASSVDVSSDGKTYTFVLRDAKWSNGDAVTAQDIEQTWKSMLAPNFPAPNAYQLYVIAGAKNYKEGLTTDADVGVTARGPRTLVVQLEQPYPNFLELLTTHFTFPLNKNWIRRVENNPELDWANAPYSGPFQYSEWVRHGHFTVKKNPHYWDRDQVKLDSVSLVVVEDSTGLNLFKQQELDWAGSPLSTLPTDALSSLKAANSHELIVTPAAGTYWLRINVNQPVVSSSTFRLALAQAINRQELVDFVLMGGQQPAITVVPPLMGLKTATPLTLTEDRDKAKQELALALKELSLDAREIPTLIISYPNQERYRKVAQALQQQLAHALNLSIGLEARESKIFNQMLASGAYQIALGSWFADLNDPMNFLEIFESKERTTNHTGWSQPAYQALIERASKEKDLSGRNQEMEKAEALLLQAMPVVPLFHSSLLSLKRPGLEGVVVNPLGYMDFKTAYWQVSQGQ